VNIDKRKTAALNFYAKIGVKGAYKPLVRSAKIPVLISFRRGSYNC
jgi:hypothetical protein